MKNWTIAKRLIVGFGIVVTIALMLGVFAIFRLSSINTAAVDIKQDSVPGVVLFDEIAAGVRDNEVLCLQMALTEDKAREAEIEKQIAAASAHNDELFQAYEKTIFTDDDRRKFEDVKTQKTQVRAVRTAFLEYARTHNAKDSGVEFDRALKPALAAYLEAVQVELDDNKDGATKGVDQISSMVASTRRHRRGRLARRDVGVDGRDGIDGAQELREHAGSGRVDERSRPARQRIESGAVRDGRVDDGHSGLERESREDHQDDRRDRLPDEHPRAQRSGRSRPRRRGRHGLCGGRRRSAQSGAALGAGGQRHGQPHRRIPAAVAGRQRQGRSGRDVDW